MTKKNSKPGAWTRKEGKNPKGGLNAKGRASAKKEEMNLKPSAPNAKAGTKKSNCGASTKPSGGKKK